MDSGDVTLKRALAIAIVKRRREQSEELQKWKSLAATLEDQVEQIRQQRNLLEQQLQQERKRFAELLEADRHPDNPQQRDHQRAGPLGACFGENHGSFRTCLELCRQKAGALRSAGDDAADPSSHNIQSLSTLDALQLGPLAAETGQLLGDGVSEESGRFLMEVRCMQLAALSTRKPPSTAQTSPLQAVVWFVLGPLLAMPPGALQSAYASDALAFILQQQQKGDGQKERDTLHALSLGLLRATAAAEPCSATAPGKQKSAAPAAPELASDFLAALLQLPVAGVSVLRAAAAELRHTVRSLAKRSRESKGGGSGAASEQLEIITQADLLFPLLEDCLVLLPAWMHELHGDASISADVAQATEDVLAAHKACTANVAQALPELVTRTRSLATSLITSLERTRDCTWQ